MSRESWPVSFMRVDNFVPSLASNWAIGQHSIIIPNHFAYPSIVGIPNGVGDYIDASLKEKGRAHGGHQKRRRSFEYRIIGQRSNAGHGK